MALQDLIVQVSHHLREPPNADHSASVSVIDRTESAEATAILVPGGPQQDMPHRAVPDNLHGPAFADPTTAISKKLDILLVDASLRLQAQLQADADAPYAASATHLGIGDGLNRGLGREVTATVPSTDDGRASEAFRAPVPTQNWTPHDAVDTPVRRAKYQGSGHIRQLRTLGLLVVGGSGLFLAGIGVGMYQATPRRAGIEETAVTSQVLTEVASTPAPQSPAEMSTIEQSAVVTSPSPVQTYSGPTPVGPALEDAAPPSVAASEPDMTADARPPIAGLFHAPEPDAVTQTNDVAALDERTSARPEAVTVIEPIMSPMSDPATPTTVQKQSSATAQPQPRVDPPLPAPTASAKRTSKPENGTWVAAVKPMDRTAPKSSARTKTTEDPIRYAPALMSLRDANAVLQVFISLQKRHAILSDKVPVPRPVDRDGQTWYKLHVGPAMSERDARATCEALGAEGQALGCTVEVHDANSE
jgi:hypothetical protein